MVNVGLAFNPAAFSRAVNPNSAQSVAKATTAAAQGFSYPDFSSTAFAAPMVWLK